MFEIYCDGSSKGNPGKGGWATVIYKDGRYITHRAEYQDEVTNNRMELTALAYGLLFANNLPEDEEINIYCDSAYCVNAMNDWILGWRKANWKRSKNQEVKNQDLFEKMYPLYWQENIQGIQKKKKNINILKVHGHAGIIGNELADALAADNKSKLNIIINQIKTGCN